MSDQNRVSPYNINTILSRIVMKIYQNIKKQLLFDSIASSQNSHHKNCQADSKENYKWDLGSENVNQILNLLLVSAAFVMAVMTGPSLEAVLTVLIGVVVLVQEHWAHILVQVRQLAQNWSQGSFEQIRESVCWRHILGATVRWRFRGALVSCVVFVIGHNHTELSAPNYVRAWAGLQLRLTTLTSPEIRVKKVLSVEKPSSKNLYDAPR